MAKIKVFIIESSLGFGRSIDEEKEFDTYEEAEEFCKKYNNRYNSREHTPDWYMYARIENQKGFGMIR